MTMLLLALRGEQRTEQMTCKDVLNYVQLISPEQVEAIATHVIGFMKGMCATYQKELLVIQKYTTLSRVKPGKMLNQRIQLPISTKNIAYAD